ncbi:MAG: hypothetical protein MI717_09765, partial [Spirochaetales bacterium]|nr:hypothetical protein [Spirochaetales bacterium]
GIAVESPEAKRLRWGGGDGALKSEPEGFAEDLERKARFPIAVRLGTCLIKSFPNYFVDSAMGQC